MEIFLGVIVSTIVQIIKNYTGTTKTGTMVAVVSLSFVGALCYWLLAKYNLWESFYQILITAGAFYAFIIKNVESITVK